MLNISENQNIGHLINPDDYQSFKTVSNPYRARTFAKYLMVLFLAFLVILFLPWTQNIQIEGKLTSLRPEERPQTIHATIPGSIQKWYVMEGQQVRKGDTILMMGETKEKFFDPNILDRLKEQVSAKESSIVSYQSKIDALTSQNNALETGKRLKYRQTINKVVQSRLKVETDSAEFVAAKSNLDIAKIQYDNAKTLFQEGIKSLVDYQDKEQKYLQSKAKLVSAENKLDISRNELINAIIEQNSVIAQYDEKISKNMSDISSAASSLYDAQATLSKLKNDQASIVVRKGFLYILAPQDAYITKSLKVGIGETVKEGSPLVSIMPLRHQLAAELYVKPVDLPLIGLHHKVRLIFDGWPVVVFSGWPNLSYGTFGGEIVAVDNMISDNGKYRILVSPDHDEHEWPHALRLGSGAKGFALLNQVPVWKEIWRQLNGFPPDFYSEYQEHSYIKNKVKDDKLIKK